MQHHLSHISNINCAVRLPKQHKTMGTQYMSSSGKNIEWTNCGNSPQKSLINPLRVTKLGHIRQLNSGIVANQEGFVAS